MTEAENNWCDECDTKVAVYIEKQRRAGKLTRDQICAGCLGKHARKQALRRAAGRTHPLPPNQVLRGTIQWAGSPLKATRTCATRPGA